MGLLDYNIEKPKRTLSNAALVNPNQRFIDEGKLALEEQISASENPYARMFEKTVPTSQEALIEMGKQRIKKSEHGLLGELGAGLGRGALRVVATPAYLADIAGEAVGWKGLERAGEVGAEKVEEFIEESPRLKKSISISGDIRDNPQLWTDPRWYLSLIGEGAPTVASMIIPGMAAARIAKGAGMGVKAVKAARFGGAITAGMGLEAGGAAEDVRQYEKRTGEKVPINKKLQTVTGTGVVAGSFEAIPIFNLFGGTVAKKLIGRIVTSMALEGGTEGAQEIVANAFAKAGYEADRDMVGGVIESVVGGVLLGGGMGAMQQTFQQRINETNPNEVANILEQAEKEIIATPEEIQLFKDAVESGELAKDIKSGETTLEDMLPAIERITTQDPKLADQIRGMFAVKETDLIENERRFEEDPLDAENNAEYLDKYIKRAALPEGVALTTEELIKERAKILEEAPRKPAEIAAEVFEKKLPIEPTPTEPTAEVAREPVSVEAKNSWEMTQEEFGDSIPSIGYGETQRQLHPEDSKIPYTLRHRWVVEAALKENKPIPESVLAEYPDLKPVKKIAAEKEEVALFGTLPERAKGAIASDAMIKGQKAKEFIHSEWVRKIVNIESLKDKNESVWSDKFIYRKSESKDPLIVSTDGEVLDGNNRLREAIERDDKQIEILERKTFAKPLPPKLPEAKPSEAVREEIKGEVIPEPAIIPKELKPLTEEAKKYKNVEEFEKVAGKTSTDLANWGYSVLQESGKFKTIDELEKAAESLDDIELIPSSFYNQAKKGEVIPEVKPKVEKEKVEVTPKVTLEEKQKAATGKYSPIFGTREKMPDGTTWELVAVNDKGIPYFSKVVRGKVQKKEFTLPILGGKEWLDKQLKAPKPKEKPTIKKEYFVHVREGSKKVEGKPIEIEGFEKYDLFYSKEAGQFSISETTTGLGIATESTLKGAKQKTLETLIANKDRIDKLLKEAPKIKDVKPIEKPTGVEAPEGKVFATKEVYEKDLIAYHNTTETELLSALESGGLAMPSIAITRKDIPFEKYGPITLIGRKETIDPTGDRVNRVFDSDIYSPRVPGKEWKVNQKPANDMFARFEPIMDEMGEYKWGFEQAYEKGKEQLLDYADRSNALKVAFLREQNISIQIPKRQIGFHATLSENKDIQDYMKNLDYSLVSVGLKSKEHKQFSEVIKKAIAKEYEGKEDGAFIAKTIQESWFDEDGFLSFGFMGKFEQDQKILKEKSIEVDKYKLEDRLKSKFTKKLSDQYLDWINKIAEPVYSEPFIRLGRQKVPYTLDNIVKAMKREGLKGEEKTMVFGPAKARAKAAKQIPSIKAMHELKGRLVTEEKVQEAIKVQEKIREKFTNELVDHYRYNDWRGKTDIWAALDDAMKATGAFLSGQVRTISRMQDVLKRHGFDNVSALLARKAINFSKVLMDTPTQYFEFKSPRAVDFSEFEGAVIPTNASLKLRRALKEAGLTIKTYKEYDSVARQKAVSSFYKKKDVLFATKTIKPQDTITRADLKSIFAKMKNISTGVDKDGNFFFRPFGKPVVTIYEVNEVKGYIDTSKGQIPVGSFLGNTIELKTGGEGHTADIGTAWHEFTHYLEKNGILSGNDIKALNGVIAKSEGISESKVTEEHRATYVGDRLSEWQGQKNLRIKRVLKKITDFVNSIWEFVTRTRTARGVLVDIETGRLIGKEGVSERAGALIPAYQMAGEKAIGAPEEAKAFATKPTKDYKAMLKKYQEAHTTPLVDELIKKTQENVDPVTASPEETKAFLKDVRIIPKRFRSEVLSIRDMKWYHKALETPYVLAKKFPSMESAVKTEINRHETRTKKMFDYYHGDLAELQKHMQKNKEDLKSFEALIWKWEGTRFLETEVPTDWFSVVEDEKADDYGGIRINPEHYAEVRKFLKKQGVKDVVADGFVTVRKILDNVLIEADTTMRGSNIDQSDLKEFRKYIGKAHNYFSHIREGNSYIKITNRNTKKTVYREHFWALKERTLPERKMAKARVEKWLKDQLASGELSGKKSDFIISPAQKVTKLPDEIFFQIPVEALDQIAGEAGKGLAMSRVHYEAKRLMKLEGLSEKEAHDKAYNRLTADMERHLARAFADVLKTRGWGQHAIQRQNIPGFKKTDVFETLSGYLTGYAGFATKIQSAKEHSKTLRDMDARKTPNAYKYTSAYVRDMLANADKTDQMVDRLRGLFFVKYLGGVVKSGIVNLTQNAVMAGPILSQYTKFSHTKLAKAMVDVRKGITGKNAWMGKETDYKTLSKDEQKALTEMVETGAAQDLYLRELKGEIPGKGWGKYVRKVMDKSGIFMMIAEKFNRASTGLAAFRIAFNEGVLYQDKQTKGNHGLSVQFAKGVIYDSHFLYGKPNLPAGFRGGDFRKIARAAYTFRSFTHNYLDIMVDLMANQGTQGFKAAGRSLMNLMAVGGLTSIPFFKALSEVIKWSQDDEDEDLLTEIRGTMSNKFMQDVLVYGLVGASGGFDLSGSLSIEVPRSFKELVGVPYSIYEDSMNMVRSVKAGNLYRAVSETPFTPIVMRNAMRGIELYTKGQRTRGGKAINVPGKKEPRKITGVEAIKKTALGLQPVEVSSGYKAYRAAGKMKAAMQDKKRNWADRIANATIARDFKKVGAIKKEIREWNIKARHERKIWRIVNINEMVKNRLQGKGLKGFPVKMRKEAGRRYEVWQK